MNFFDKLKSGGFGYSGGLKGLSEEISESLNVGKKSSTSSLRSTKDSLRMGGNPYVAGPIITKDDERRMIRKAENLVHRVSPEAAEKFKRFNEKRENLEQTVENFYDANSPLNIAVRLMTEAKDLSAGDHLYVQRTGYTHHGVYVGDQQIIHYLLEEGIVIASLEEFAAGANVHIKESPIYYTSEEILTRAYSRLGEKGYNLFNNNCENFVNWCRSGR